MSKIDIEVGCVVRLRSGGPKMTVVGLDTPGRITVTWFDSANQLQSAGIPVEALDTVAWFSLNQLQSAAIPADALEVNDRES